MARACKESRETHYWLRLLETSQVVEFNYKPYLAESENILNILKSIVKTSQTNIRKKKPQFIIHNLILNG